MSILVISLLQPIADNYYDLNQSVTVSKSFYHYIFFAGKLVCLRLDQNIIFMCA